MPNVKTIVITFLISAIMIGALGPVAMTQLYMFTSSSNVTGTSTATIVNLWPLFLGIAIMLGFVGYTKGVRR